MAEQALGFVLAVTIGMVAVLLLASGLFVAVRRIRGGLGGSTATSAKRLTLVVGAALVLAFAVSYVTSARASNTQTFALSGAERWTVGPFLYLAFAALLMVVPIATLQRAVSGLLRSASGGLVVLTLVSGFVGMLLGATTVVQTAQGLALIVGFALFMTVGSVVQDWDAPMRLAFIGVVVGAAALTMLLGTGLGSFPALAVPAAATVVSMARSPRLPLAARIAAVAAGTGALVKMYNDSAGSNDPSAGLQLQMAFAGGIVLIALLPRRARSATGVLLVAGIVVAIAQSPLGQLTVGGLADDPDLTLAQRGTETQAVWELVTRSPFSLLFGIGPGATVDLTRSPDAATLLASGRDLAHVPSVHLLTSYILLKAGLLGLLWLGAVIARLIQLTVEELRQPQPGPFAVLLLCLPWCGLAGSTPAATFFFSNPLCALGLGLLIGRARLRRRAQEDESTPLSSPPRLVRTDSAVPPPTEPTDLGLRSFNPTAPRSAWSLPARRLSLPPLVPSPARARRHLRWRGW